MTWIDPAERLPEIGQLVLVRIGGTLGHLHGVCMYHEMAGGVLLFEEVWSGLTLAARDIDGWIAL